jgi:hypothetical protein
MCVVTCSGSKRETRQVTKTINPKWSKDNSFSFILQDLQSCDITVQVYDKRQEMGRAVIKPTYIFGASRPRKIEKWFDLVKNNSIKAGQIQLTIEQQDMFDTSQE